MVIQKIETERRWYKCPGCGKNAVIVDDTAEAHGVYMKCKRCGREFEIRIKQGK